MDGHLTAIELGELAEQLQAELDRCSTFSEKLKVRQKWEVDIKSKYGDVTEKEFGYTFEILEARGFSEGKAEPTHGVLLIHGIRTDAFWGEMVSSVFEAKAGIEVIPIRYGFFSSLRFLFPLCRGGPAKRVAKELRFAKLRFSSVSVIAHSFGTYTVVRCLVENRDIRINRLIFCGCVLPKTFHRSEIQGQIGDGDILNDCGTRDMYPVIADSCSWGYGSTGTFGMGSVGVRDRFNKFRHGDYFGRDFVEKYWVPFIADGQILRTEWEVERKQPKLYFTYAAYLKLKYILPFAAIIWLLAR